MKKPDSMIAVVAALSVNTKALEANTQALRGELRVAMEEIRRSLATMDSQKNLIPALCHSLDRLQAEFSALRLQAMPKAKGKRK